MQTQKRQIGQLLNPGRRRLMLAALTAAMTIAVACGSGDDPAPTATSSTVPRTSPASTPLPDATPADTPPATQDTGAASPAATPDGGGDELPAGIDPLFVSPTGPVTLTGLDGLEESAAKRHQLNYNWFTDFNKRTVDLTEISNLLPRDRITPVDDPLFALASEAPGYMRAREPVIAVKINGDARAYPLAILMWQEVVNDTVGGEPLTITFCPLCNTAVAFERTLEGHELTFGTSGNLRNSDLVMWDRQTESWWQQITGEAIVGQLAGKTLTQVPAPIIAWETFLAEYPDGKLLLRVVDSSGLEIRQYDRPPYAGYDSVDTNPFAFDGPIDSRLPANVRVLTIKSGEESVAYPWPFLKEAQVINDTVGGVDLVAFFDDGTLSAFLDASSREQTSGSSTVFNREVDGQTLTFTLGERGITDEETGSVWSQTGKAISGPLAGKSLEQVIHQNHFWFAWAVFMPETEIRDSAGKVTGPVGGLPMS